MGEESSESAVVYTSEVFLALTRETSEVLLLAIK